MTRDLAALMAFIEARAAMPHVWGRYANDCVSFAAYAVKAQTGRHGLDDGGRLRWASRRGALRLLARYGGLENLIGARFVRIAPAKAMRGDIGAVADPELGIHPMIVEGATLVGPGPRGLFRLPRVRMVAAWSAVDHV